MRKQMYKRIFINIFRKKFFFLFDEVDRDKRFIKLVQFLENVIREIIEEEKKKFKLGLGYVKQRLFN